MGIDPVGVPRQTLVVVDLAQEPVQPGRVERGEVPDEALDVPIGIEPLQGSKTVSGARVLHSPTLFVPQDEQCADPAESLYDSGTGGGRGMRPS